MADKAVSSPVVEAVSGSVPAGTPKKTAVKSKQPRVKPAHPKAGEMVIAAITALKERGGSSLQAIKKYVAGTYKVDADKQATFIKKYLKAAVASGILVQTKGKGAAGSFKLAPNKVASVKPKAKAAAPKKAAVAKQPAAAKKPASVAAKKMPAKKPVAKAITEKKKTSKGPAAKPPKPKTAKAKPAAKSPIKKAKPAPKKAKPAAPKTKKAAPKKAATAKKWLLKSSMNSSNHQNFERPFSGPLKLSNVQTTLKQIWTTRI